MPRSSQQHMSDRANADLTAVLEDLGLAVRPAGHGSDADLIVDVDGTQVRVRVRAVALATPQRAAAVAAARSTSDQVTSVLIADSIAASAKPILKERGWGWLDRRHRELVLRGRGLLIHTEVAALGRPERRAPDPLTGGAAKTYAAALLMDPDHPPSIRAVARASGWASATVGEAAQRLRAAALVRADGRPLHPELFWELAGVWTEHLPVPLAHLPGEAELGPPLEMTGQPGGLSGMGAALAGTAAALAYGAPLAVAGNSPPDFYLPSPADVSSYTRRLGLAARIEDRACTVTVAPVPLVCTRTFPIPANSQWRLEHPLFAALDLAQDRTRGREILERFTPPEGFTRVW